MIADDTLRQDFAVDARATLEKAGVPLDHIPPSMIDRLGRLGVDELSIIAEHCDDLMKHGFYAELPEGGHACLF